MSYKIKMHPKRRIFARLLGEIHEQLYSAFLKRSKDEGLTKTELANKLGVHKSLVTRKFSGTSNLSIRTLAEMAWALKHHPEFTMTPFEEIEGNQTSYNEVCPESSFVVFNNTNYPNQQVSTIPKPTISVTSK